MRMAYNVIPRLTFLPEKIMECPRFSESYGPRVCGTGLAWRALHLIYFQKREKLERGVTPRFNPKSSDAREGFRDGTGYDVGRRPYPRTSENM